MTNGGDVVECTSLSEHIAFCISLVTKENEHFWRDNGKGLGTGLGWHSKDLYLLMKDKDNTDMQQNFKPKTFTPPRLAVDNTIDQTDYIDHTKKSFMMDYVLTRASHVNNFTDYRGACYMAENLYDEICKRCKV